MARNRSRIRRRGRPLHLPAGGTGIDHFLGALAQHRAGLPTRPPTRGARCLVRCPAAQHTPVASRARRVPLGNCPATVQRAERGAPRCGDGAPTSTVARSCGAQCTAIMGRFCWGSPAVRGDRGICAEPRARPGDCAAGLDRGPSDQRAPTPRHPDPGDRTLRASDRATAGAQ